jgi:outer membrane protein assembly factor BamB
VDDSIFIATIPDEAPLRVVVANGQVFVGTGLQNPGPDQTRLYALDPQTGEERWSYAEFPANESGLYAFDAGTGDLQWMFPIANLDLLPAVMGDTVYVGSSNPGAPGNGTIFALDTASGDLRWSSAGHGLAPNYSALTLAVGQVIVVEGFFGTISSLDPMTGEENWRVPPPDQSINSTAIVGDEIYLMGGSGLLTVLSAKDGQKRWTHKLELVGLPYPPPVVSNGVLFIGTYVTVSPQPPGRIIALENAPWPDRSDREAT